MRPIIGITGNFLEDENLIGVRKYYLDAVFNAGGLGIILPPVADEVVVNNYINICHGFIFSGGGDLNPFYWGEEALPAVRRINPLRDRFEMMLAVRLLGGNKPVLGICRGCQVLNVAAGGSLIQDISTSLSHEQNAPCYYPFHDIFIEKGSILHRILGAEKIRVNSFHHQAVDKPGANIKITARAADGIAEALESQDHPFVIGVQWHPECMEDKYSFYLFRSLVSSCLKYSC
ncbi:putative glutamine amidotransferase [Thermosyntropha lipolytica DSM 11003]|uniref:Putative glutamine amidotransferase n=1 Tax=Thermosyntropha lipolytica DSM 11003 TaxID=1123382 RepID=A0A1M5JFV8_9FIRM|nr:gamma-glutamyl-gamma-aminobutyrate hydrolase family protein [Thermosyntropha lipolytica]SHG39170.1 putative glutamine amidotransferase [Thermosyntropha lipolytica DSM 11003]